MDWLPTITNRRGPAYQRIVDALADDIAAGRLHQGRRLPTHRALATALGLDVTTVTRAYAEAARQQLIEAHVGRGTFVKADTAGLRRTAAPAIDLSMILPPLPEGMDLDGRIAATLTEIRRQSGFAPHLTYQMAGGSPAERGVAAEWLRLRVPGLTAARTLVAPGTQATLASLLLALCAPGETVLCEALTYPGLKRAAALARVVLRGVPLDAEGVIPSKLAAACKTSGAKVVVLTPTMHNPTTATIPPARRARVAEVIARYRLTLIEDDPYIFLDPDAQPLATLIPERTYLAASLSKCLAPGLRTSILVSPDAASSQLASDALRATTQMSTPLMTAVALRWMQNGIANEIIASVRDESAARARLCREVLGHGTFAEQSCSPHIWLKAPPQSSSGQISTLLHERGLGVMPGEAFAVTHSAPTGIRLALGAVRSIAALRTALGIVARVMPT